MKRKERRRLWLQIQRFCQTLWIFWAILVLFRLVTGWDTPDHYQLGMTIGVGIMYALAYRDAVAGRDIR